MEEDNRKAKLCGIIFSAVFHAALLLICFSAGLKYLDPPPAERSILLDFEEEPVPLEEMMARTGIEPRADTPDPDKEVELVRRSESNVKGKKANQAEESTIGDHGDVEVPEPARKKEINKKALFSSADNSIKKDTLAAQTASRVSDALSAGHASGNTDSGASDGKPSAHLAGRSVMGALPLPDYPVRNTSGKVVVKITVDRKGNVTTAIPGASGTTVSSRELLDAAKKAALKAKFNVSESAPASQEGTITYIFTLH